MQELISGLSRVPDLVVPMTPLSIIGHSVLALMGLLVLAVGSVIVARASSLAGGLAIAVFGAWLITLAQYRFLRAIAPTDVGPNVLGWVLAILTAVVGSFLLVRHSWNSTGGWTFALGVLVATLVARAFDGLHEHMHSVPVSWTVVLFIAVGIWAYAADRR